MTSAITQLFDALLPASSLSNLTRGTAQSWILSSHRETPNCSSPEYQTLWCLPVSVVIFEMTGKDTAARPFCQGEVWRQALQLSQTAPNPGIISFTTMN
jgi:hypothetical protein